MGVCMCMCTISIKHARFGRNVCVCVCMEAHVNLVKGLYMILQVCGNVPLFACFTLFTSLFEDNGYIYWHTCMYVCMLKIMHNGIGDITLLFIIEISFRTSISKREKQIHNIIFEIESFSIVLIV